VAPGCRAVVTGPNGSGKTTLLRLAAGLLRPSGGTRRAGGSAVYLGAGHGARAVMPVRVAVTEAAALAGAADPAARAAAALEVTGLSGFATLPVRTLSAGRGARLSLAVAVAVAPGLVCLDEPTAHLDHTGSALVGDVLAVLRAAGTSVLIATHDPAWPAWLPDAVLHVDAGRVSQTRRVSQTSAEAVSA
jgi:ABC-type multidrug transport system ATPase subunit